MPTEMPTETDADDGAGKARTPRISSIGMNARRSRILVPFLADAEPPLLLEYAYKGEVRGSAGRPCDRYVAQLSRRLAVEFLRRTSIDFDCQYRNVAKRPCWC